MLRFAEYLELQDFRERTIEGYYRVARVMSDHFDKDPALLSEGEIRQFFVHVRCERVWAPKSTRKFEALLPRNAGAGMLDSERHQEQGSRDFAHGADTGGGSSHFSACVLSALSHAAVAYLCQWTTRERVPELDCR